jgi:hypothetical protein
VAEKVLGAAEASARAGVRVEIRDYVAAWLRTHPSLAKAQQARRTQQRLLPAHERTRARRSPNEPRPAGALACCGVPAEQTWRSRQAVAAAGPGGAAGAPAMA